MILIWKGGGAVIVFLAILFTILAGGALRSAAPSPLLAQLAIPAAAVLAGIATLVSGFKLNGGGTNHSLYFIPVQYWGILIIVGGIIMGGAAGTGETGTGGDPAKFIDVPGHLAQQRTWRNREGKSMTGTLTAINGNGSRIRIRTAKGKDVTIKSADLSDADRDYILEIWEKLHEQAAGPAGGTPQEALLPLPGRPCRRDGDQGTGMPLARRKPRQRLR